MICKREKEREREREKEIVKRQGNEREGIYRVCFLCKMLES